MTVEVSELLDGEVSERECDRALSSLKRDPAARLAWERYCLVGDALRGLNGLSPGFSKRVMARIDAEPTVVAPVAGVARRRRTVSAAMAMAASVAGVAVVSWLALSSPDPVASPSVARLESPAMPVPVEASGTGAAPAPVLARAQETPRAAAEVTPYLFVHSGYMPSRTMQGVVPYVRVVSETPQGIGR